MTEEQVLLWHKIRSFDIDDSDSTFTFTDRLARENGWTFSYSVRTIEEYKKFIFLLCNSNKQLTPSDQVDQVWHLHLLYTKSYWKELCEKTIQREIHHGSTKGGQKEKEKYNNFYEDTKKTYREIFQSEPPIDIWPTSKVRFKEINFIRVNAHKYWIIPKLKFLQ
ncbi:MAG TPA: hypothetical protein VK169_14940 [Saprospiraceae bacterium]|nr:hypothetical protein [Saprospiraceae bacterium]